MNNLWYLENVNLFSLLCPHKFKEFSKNHTFNIYNKLDYIYFAEDVANKIYLIEKGKVKLGYYTSEGEEVVNAILSKGEIFGEKAILGEQKRDEFAQALTNDTSICPIGATTLQDLIRSNKNFALGFYKFINFRFKRLERRLQILLYKDTKTRLLEFIYDMYEDFGVKKTEEKKVINHPYSQKEIAILIGTSRPTLNIIMNELKDNGIIDFHHKNIIIHQLKA